MRLIEKPYFAHAVCTMCDMAGITIVSGGYHAFHRGEVLDRLQEYLPTGEKYRICRGHTA